MSNRFFTALVALVIMLGAVSNADAKSAKKERQKWAEAADYSTGFLVDNFWRVPGNGFIGDKPSYHFTNKIKGVEDLSNNYWPQAHGMDVLIDAYLRAKKAGDRQKTAFYQECFDLGYKNPIGDGSSRNSTGVLWTSYGGDQYSDISACFGNQFVDDMQWHALTLIRLYEATNEAIYLSEAQKLYAQIWKAWDLPAVRSLGGAGGFLWCYGKEDTRSGLAKNACSNAPGCLVAIRLHEVKKSMSKNKYKLNSHPDYVDFDYLENAKTIYDWMSKELFNRATGQVYGGMTVNGGLHKAFSLTYDQGTFMGAAHLLFKHTGDRRYAEDAVKAAIYTITNPGIVRGGMLRDEGAGGDNSLFKGIFIRYAVPLVNDKSIDKSVRLQLYKFLNHQAETIWTKGLARDEKGSPVGVFTPDWSLNQKEVLKKGEDYKEPGLGWQVSGATLIEAMNVMRYPR